MSGELDRDQRTEQELADDQAQNQLRRSVDSGLAARADNRLNIDRVARRVGA